MKDVKKGRKEVGEAKCNSCFGTRDRNNTVRIGGRGYHPECAEARPKQRQQWDGHKWVRL